MNITPNFDRMSMEGTHCQNADGSMRVPMGLTGPGFTSGGQLQEMISLVDIPPTLLDACGIPVPADTQGRSFAPLTRERLADWPEEVYAEIFETNLSRCVRTKRWRYSVRKTEEGPEKGNWWVFREDCLYDLLADPYELNNLAGLESHRQVANVMKERLVRRMAVAGEDKPDIEPAPTIPDRLLPVSVEETHH